MKVVLTTSRSFTAAYCAGVADTPTLLCSTGNCIELFSKTMKNIDTKPLTYLYSFISARKNSDHHID